MFKTTLVRRHFAELVVVFVGVALAFAVENIRESLNERAIGDQYLSGFLQDLIADLDMLEAQQEDRQLQLDHASIVLKYFEGRPIDPQGFFEAYYTSLKSLDTTPNRNTLDEVLSSGNLRLIRDLSIRSGLLELYATYDKIALLEEHMSRDFDVYLYDPTFSSIPLQIEGPWANTPVNQQYIETLSGDVRIENGLRLLVINLQGDGGVFEQLDSARSQVERLLQLIPGDE